MAITQKPMPITMASAVTSTRVSTTLNFTLSPTPRRLIRARNTMNPSATTSVAVVEVGTPPMVPSRPASRLAASRLEDVEALVMPEQTTVKATRNVTK